MNDVLRFFMHLKLGGFLYGDETIDAFRDGESAGEDERMTWGQMEEERRKIREEMADGTWKMDKLVEEAKAAGAAQLLRRKANFHRGTDFTSLSPDGS